MGHSDLIRERIKGRYALVCQRCGHSATWPRQKLKARRLKDKPTIAWSRHNVTPLHREKSS